jgi:cell filamentation protein
MYRAAPDSYCYPGSTILRNVPGIRSRRTLARFEAAITVQRAAEPLPGGRLGVRHYRSVHRHIFQDVYAWAGRFRTIRIAKEGSMFCYPEFIEAEMRALFDRLRRDRYLRELSAEEFAEQASVFLSTLNAIHPFRDGNGRTQLIFMALVADRAGHPLAFEKLAPRRFLDAMIASFHGRDDALVRELRSLMA